MKKWLLLAAVAVFVFTANAQDEFNAGISAGLPVGDAGDDWTSSVILDLNYLWEVSDQFDAGIASGYSHSFGDSVDYLEGFGGFDVEDASFLPLAVVGRVHVSE